MSTTVQVRTVHSHRARYREIASVLARHGLSSLVGTMGLARFLPIHRRAATRSDVHRPDVLPVTSHALTRAEHLRLALEELGAAFIKLGQILSTRVDLLPPAYQAELALLQDSAPTVPIDEVRRLIIEELGRPPEEIFAHFEPVPVAAASIGQAHAATLKNGTQVIVKVRRPGVVEQVEQDLEIFSNLAAVAARRWRMAEQYDVVGLAQELSQTLRAELDYVREGHNAERFAEHFQGNPDIHVPGVFWQLTTSRVLVLERVQGIKISDVDALDKAGIDRKALAVRATRLLFKMILEDGFFHADPHPGNFFIEPDGRVALIDYGMVGVVHEHTREHLVGVLLAVNSQDTDRIVDSLLQLGVVVRRVNRVRLRQDIDHLMSRYYGRPLGEISASAIINDGLDVVRRHHLQLPSSLALMAKVALMTEGLGLQLDPSFNLSTVVAPYTREIVQRENSPRRWARMMAQAGFDAAQLSAELPEQMRRLLMDIQRGGLEVGTRPEGFDPLFTRLERIANRIVLGVLASAFIIGLAIVLAVYKLPGWDQWAGAFFAVGFLAACALGIYLAWSIFRSGHS